MPTSDNLAALMRKWPLNSITLVTATHSKLKKAVDGTSTQVATYMINKWRAKINGKEVYNVRDPPGMGDRKIDCRKTVAVFTTLKSFCNQSPKNQEGESVLGSSPRINYHSSPHVFDHSIYLRSCPVVATLTKAQFLSPFSIKFIVLGPLDLSLFT